MRKLIATLLVYALALAPGTGSLAGQQRGEITLATTTSTEDTGLLDSRRYRAEKCIILRAHHEVHIDRRPPPPKEHRCRAAHQMDAHVHPCRASKRLH